MKYLERVIGSKDAAVPIIIGPDTVYIHENVKKISTDSEVELYEYSEIQYTKDEYLLKMTQENRELNNTVQMLMTDLLPSIEESGGEE